MFFRGGTLWGTESVMGTLRRKWNKPVARTRVIVSPAHHFIIMDLLVNSLLFFQFNFSIRDLVDNIDISNLIVVFF